MAKLIVVSRETLEASHRELEELLAKDPHWQEQKKEMERYFAEEKARRDAEFAAKQATQEGSGKQATSLQPFFSLTPSNPWIVTYDPANPDAAWAGGQLDSYGGITAPSTPFMLDSQSNNDEIVVGYDPVEPGDNTIGTFEDFSRHCAIRVLVMGSNVSTENQYLLVFALHGFLHGFAGEGPPTAQIFVDFSLVRTEELIEDETVAILMDCPGSKVWTMIIMRLAASHPWPIMSFKGVTCYLL